MTPGCQGRAGPYCPWTAESTVGWIRILKASVGDPGAFTYAVDANTTGATRTGVIRAADKTLTVTQLP
jgi:hypothetical protein